MYKSCRIFLIPPHRITYFKTTSAMQSDTIKCIIMITSIAGAYSIQRLSIDFIVIITHTSDSHSKSTTIDLRVVV
ncbi:hypothetical protein BH18THE2_BH18THE2_32230 [soil metagenome]